MDVICVFDGNSKPFCTEFHVRFRSPLVDETTVSILGLNDVPNIDENHPVFPVLDTKRISDSATKAHLAGQPVPKNDHVQVTVNGINMPELKAFIGEEQFLYFYDAETKLHSRTPSCAVLAKFDLKVGKNTVTCIHFGSNLQKEFNIWRLHSTDSLIVMDIDGTITKSDITGYIQTVYMGLFSHVHDGIVPFLNTLKDRYNYTIVYLTARPLIHQRETRLLLEGIKDSSGRTMPDGPLFPSKDKLLAALYREVISKTTVKMKSGVLGEINRVFRRAGCTRITPFVLGVGNKENDAFAYNLAGLNAENILLIDKSSRIEVWKHKQLQQMHYAHAEGGSGGGMHAHSAHGRSNNISAPTNLPDHIIAPATTSNTPYTNTSDTSTTSNTFTALGSSKSIKSTSGKSPRLERAVSDGLPVVRAVTPGGGESFAIARDDTIGVGTGANYTVYEEAAPALTIDTLTNNSTHSNTSGHSSLNTTDSAGFEHSQRMFSTELSTDAASYRTDSNMSNISITNSDYFGVRNSVASGSRSLSTTDKSLNMSTAVGSAEHNDFQACSLPAEKRSIWGFMQRKSPHRDADNGHCLNNHVFQTYNDDRLMEYVHKLCGK